MPVFNTYIGQNIEKEIAIKKYSAAQNDYAVFQ